ncbi:MAG: hypothetical protein O6939_07975 [Bacteroidetes bacterium]|nr:hypothetical protein [Bacteroidota bacterium]
MPLIQELKDRKIAQTLVIYLGGGWVLIEALNFFIEKYDWSSRIFDIIIFLIIFGLPVTLLYAWFHGKSEPSKVRKKELSEKSIAVLPFLNISNDPEQKYFSDGLTEELINGLTRIKELKVVARTSAFALQDQNLDIREIGERLNVANILEGSVRRAGNNLRITAQLISIHDGYHLWSKKFDRQISDIFTIQDEITLKIIENLKITIVGSEKQRALKRHTKNIDAYSLYLKGRHFSWHFTAQSFYKAIEFFNKAVEKDPGYTLAFAGLADLYSITSILGSSDPKEMLKKAKGYAKKAISLDDSLAEAHSSIGLLKMIGEWNWKEAGNEFEHALELGPGSSSIHLNYSVYLMALGRFSEAIQYAKKGTEIDPLSPMVNQNLGFILWTARKFDESVLHLRNALELDPRHAWAQLEIGWNYAFMGMMDEAIVECSKALNLDPSPSPWFRTTIGCIYAMANDNSWTLKLLDELKDLSKTTYIDPFNFAVLYTWLKDKDNALSYLEKAHSEHSPLLYFILPGRSLWFEPINNEARFNEVLRSVTENQ